MELEIQLYVFAVENLLAVLRRVLFNVPSMLFRCILAIIVCIYLDWFDSC